MSTATHSTFLLIAINHIMLPAITSEKGRAPHGAARKELKVEAQGIL